MLVLRRSPGQSIVIFLQTSKTINFQQLLRTTVRLRHDKICMGECRGAEMLTLLKCWNIGTPVGLATLHANSAHSALIRIRIIFHTLKTEWTYHQTYPTREEAKQSIFEYIEVFYNRKRFHSANQYLSPMEFEKLKIAV
jgi:Flp pilus assembly CpaF family ATPase